MSRETRDRVWAHSRFGGSQLVLLLALAERADPNGVCWPGHDELKARCRLGESQRKENLKQVENAGEILSFCAGGKRRGGHGEGQGNLYVVTVGLQVEAIVTLLSSHPELQKRGLAMSEIDAESCARSLVERSEIPVQERVKERRQKPIITSEKTEQRGRISGPLKVPKGPDFRLQRGRNSGAKEPGFRPLESASVIGTGARFEPSENRQNEPSVCTHDAPAQEVLSRFDPLLLAVLKVLDADERWAMGSVSAKFQHDLHKLMAWLKQQKRGPDDVTAYAVALPTFLRKPAALVTPPTPGQMLDNFDRVLRAAQNSAIENQNGTHQSNPSAAEKRGSALVGHFGELDERAADIQRRKREAVESIAASR